MPASPSPAVEQPVEDGSTVVAADQPEASEPVTTVERGAVVMRFLQEQQGGTSTRRAVHEAVFQKLGHRFRPSDFDALKKAKASRWQNRIDQMVCKWRNEGLIAPGTQAGVWTLTPEGLACDPDRIPRPPRSRHPNRPPMLAPGQGLPQREFVEPILTVLRESGGVASSQDVKALVYEHLKDRLEQRDYEIVPPFKNLTRWQARCNRVAQLLVQRGLLSGSSRQGVWELTEEGLSCQPDEHGSSASAMTAAPEAAETPPCQLAPAAAAVLHRQRKPGVSVQAFLEPVLRFLQAQKGGHAPRPQIIEAMNDQLGHRFTERDLALSTGNARRRWYVTFYNTYRKLKAEGLLAKNTKRGMWALTSKGKQCDPNEYREKTHATHWSTFEVPIVSALLRLGGMAWATEVTDAVYEDVKHLLLPGDFDTVSSNQVRWRANAQFARRSLINLGIVADTTPHGPAPLYTWVLTDWALGRTTDHPQSEQQTTTTTAHTSLPESPTEQLPASMSWVPLSEEVLRALRVDADPSSVGAVDNVLRQMFCLSARSEPGSTSTVDIEAER